MCKKEMQSKYEPSSVEKGRYKWWVENKFFEADIKSKKTPYTIVLPPPNVTGKLHIGHAWDGALQDIITRMKRMQGFEVLFLPGMDHAGIATQAKVEEKLRKQKILRTELGRKKFVEEVWRWKDEYAAHIREQWAKLGLGLDYSKERFTLDEGLSKAVGHVFVDLYNKGIIYRGERIINWDPVIKTALSDIEVVYKEIIGALYHFRYPLADGSGYIDIATTRPETMLGDSGIAVNPNDLRYKHLIGKTVLLPIVNRKIPIVADDYCQMEFGTGAVKITPAHDPNDFEIGTGHNLERILVMNEDGTMNALAGKYCGLDRFTCRKEIVADLKEMGVCIKVEEYVHQVGHSERSGAVIEPYLSKQWFVKMESLAKNALLNQKSDNKVEFVPPRFEKTFIQWMEKIQDWCISRQLWWGHQIPAWTNKETGEIYVGLEEPDDSECWEQDPDVLDTWFSSALWAFSPLGWPVMTEKFQKFYPTSTLVTGYDIIFFWVARMIFQGLEFTGKIPFEKVLIHGLVRDEQGRKMSKSLGNGVDPMDEIAHYGADSLRFYLATTSSPGQDLRYTKSKMEATWNFANKIWNAARFCIMNLGDFTYDEVDLSKKLSVADSWILTRLNETISDVTRLGEKFEFGEVGRLLTSFIWDDFCDWYIEMTKLSLNSDNEVEKITTRSVLTYVLDNTLRLLHPFMPFISEEIWQNIPHKGDSIVKASWPVAETALSDEGAKATITLISDVIRAVRNIRAEVNTPLSKKINLLIRTNADTQNLLVANKRYLERFCNPDELVISSDLVVDEDVMSAVVTGAEIFIPLAGLINVKEEVARLTKELQKLTNEVLRLEKKLGNDAFLSKAPQDVIALEKAKLDDYLKKKEAIVAQLNKLQ